MASAQFSLSSSNVRYRTIASGTSSKEVNQKIRIANNSTDFENLWGPILQQARTIPIVDFNQDRVVVFFVGQRTTGGYSAQVSSVRGLGGTSAEAFIREITPADGTATTQALTSPWVAIAIERTYLDISAKFTKVQDNSAGSYAVGPYTTITPLPWSPCGYGYGGTWNDPCGFGFGSPYEFQNWCDRNSIGYPLNMGSVNWTNNQLFFISGGNFGLGFGLQIGNIFSIGNETVVQVQRGTPLPDRSQRTYTMVTLPRNLRNIQVEFLPQASETYIGAGYGAMRSNSLVLQREADLMGALSSARLDPGVNVQQFDFKDANLAVVQPPQVKTGFAPKLLKVAYRGNQAVAYFTGEAKPTTLGSAAPVPPRFFLLKLNKKVRSVRIEMI